MRPRSQLKIVKKNKTEWIVTDWAGHIGKIPAPVNPRKRYTSQRNRRRAESQYIFRARQAGKLTHTPRGCPRCEQNAIRNLSDVPQVIT